MLAVALQVAVAAPLLAQDREDYPEPCPNETAQAPCPGVLVLPPRYDPARSYPVVVFLPYTTGTADALLSRYASQAGLDEPPEPRLSRLLKSLEGGGMRERDFILVLPAGLGSPFDYATGEDWSHTILKYEARVRGDLARLAGAHLIDTTRVVLAGFSLGGDLAWALALRDPARIRGAVVMGSRASYRVRPAEQRLLAERGERFYLVMGAREDSVRLRGARAAGQLLGQLGVTYRYFEFPDGQHEWAPVAVLAEALDFVLSGPR